MSVLVFMWIGRANLVSQALEIKDAFHAHLSNLFGVSEDQSKSETGMDPEHLKLVKQLSAYRSVNMKVVINEVEYKPRTAMNLATAYMKRNFKLGDNAIEWATKHTYRTDEGHIVYFKYPDGSFRPMRDVLLEDLQKNEATVSL